jgi:hypothetical protein
VRRETFQTPKPPTLEISNTSGRIEVETAETDETVVELEPLRDNEGSHAAVEEARVELRGSRLVVDVGDRSFFGLTININRDVRVTVRAPHGSSVAATGASADIDLRGRLGSLEAKTASGDLRAEDIAGDARVKSASGDVAIARIGGGANVQSASGDVAIKELGGDGQIRTASGDVNVGEAGGGVALVTASGDQRLGSVTAGRVELKSASGDILVGVRRGSRAWLDVRSISGDAESELPVGETVDDEEGPFVEITATSMSGDIRVARASETAHA